MGRLEKLLGRLGLETSQHPAAWLGVGWGVGCACQSHCHW